MRRGVISLAIGIAFLVAIFGTVRLVGQLFGESAVGMLSREGLIIVGWVAMWRPLEIFLYDWWPILAEKRIRERLSRIEVRVVAGRRETKMVLHGFWPRVGMAGCGRVSVRILVRQVFLPALIRFGQAGMPAPQDPDRKFAGSSRSMIGSNLKVLH